jgi:hypothetical protein
MKMEDVEFLGWYMCMCMALDGTGGFDVVVDGMR